MYGNYYPYAPQRQDLVRVNGIDGAKAYQMQANSVVALFDANEDVMYIKATDGAGFPSIRVFTFTEQIQTATPAADERYDRLLQTMEEIKEMISNGKQSVRIATNAPAE